MRDCARNWTTILQLEAREADRRASGAETAGIGDPAIRELHHENAEDLDVIDVFHSRLSAARAAATPAKKTGATEAAKGWRHLPTPTR